MILGIGIDAVEMSRFERQCLRSSMGNFIANTYADAEVFYCEAQGKNTLQSYAARYAVKEAVIKALSHAAKRAGVAKLATIDYRQIETHSVIDEPPELVFSGAMRDFAARCGIAAMHVSITHDGDLAIAQVVLEGA